MSTTRTLTAIELGERLRLRQVRVVDVRTPAEFETAHVPGAHNVPLDALRERRDQGGVLSWERSGGDVARGRQRWDMERQVRLVAGSLVLGSVLASTVARAARVVAGFVGGGPTVAALGNSCRMGSLLSRLPYDRSQDHDVHAVIDRLAAGRREG